jgi:hypothetical protein
MSKEVVAEVIALIELGLIAPEDIVKCLRKANSEPEKALAEQPAQQDSTCSNALREQGKAYPRTCKKCGLGPCVELAQQALNKKAENARELGLDYEPAQPTVPQDIPDLIAGALGVSRGTAYDMMREALAEQEPVATCPQDIIHAITLYGDARADQDANNAPTTSHERLADCIRLVRKALAAPVQQEPYGYVWFNKHMEHRFTRMEPLPDMGAMDIKPIYTSPPARHGWTTEQIAGMVRLKESQDKKLSQRSEASTWQGLTDEEMQNCMTWSIKETCEAIEAKLKEKNT